VSSRLLLSIGNQELLTCAFHMLGVVLELQHVRQFEIDCVDYWYYFLYDLRDCEHNRM
jgi:hypothetical protein